MLVTKFVELAMRTLLPPGSDSWLASRLFINEEAIPDMGPCVDLPANSSDTEEREGKLKAPI